MFLGCSTDVPTHLVAKLLRWTHWLRRRDQLPNQRKKTCFTCCFKIKIPAQDLLCLDKRKMKIKNKKHPSEGPTTLLKPKPSPSRRPLPDHRHLQVRSQTFSRHRNHKSPPPSLGEHKKIIPLSAEGKTENPPRKGKHKIFVEKKKENAPATLRVAQNVAKSSPKVKASNNKNVPKMHSSQTQMGHKKVLQSNFYYPSNQQIFIPKNLPKCLIKRSSAQWFRSFFYTSQNDLPNITS